MVKRFLKSNVHVLFIIKRKGGDGANSALSSLLLTVDYGPNFLPYPAIQTVIDDFALLRHNLNAMEGARLPKLQ